MAVQEKPLYYLTIHEARKLIQSRALSPVELTRAVLKRIEAVDGRLHAYLNLMADNALAEQSLGRSDREIAANRQRGRARPASGGKIPATTEAFARSGSSRLLDGGMLGDFLLSAVDCCDPYLSNMMIF